MLLRINGMYFKVIDRSHMFFYHCLRQVIIVDKSTGCLFDRCIIINYFIVSAAVAKFNLLHLCNMGRITYAQRGKLFRCFNVSVFMCLCPCP